MAWRCNKDDEKDRLYGRVAKTTRLDRGEGKLGGGWQRVIGEMLLLYGRMLDLYRNGIYDLLSEGKNNSVKNVSSVLHPI